MIENKQSLVAEIAEKAMSVVGCSLEDFMVRDKLIQEVEPILNAAIESAIESSVYALACESMARQIVDVVSESGKRTRMTGLEIAEMQLGIDPGKSNKENAE